VQAVVRIEEIELFQVAMPMLEPWRTSFSEEDAVHGVFVRMAADGREGWAETAPLRGPFYSPEYAAGVFAVLRDWLAPTVLGAEVATGEELQALMRPVKGHHFAKAGLDVAFWDLHAQAAGQPLWRLIGGERPEVEAGADISVRPSIDALLADIDAAAAAGFRRVKLKYRPGWEVEMVRAVREAFPRLTIHVDCNSAYGLDDLPMFKALDRYGLAMIEQPLAHDDLLDHAKLRKAIGTPVCLDESIVSAARARHAIELGACDWINIKVGRTGGLTNALEVYRAAAKAGVPCWVGNMLESAVGQAPALALATLPNIRYPSDIFPSRRFYAADVGEPEIVPSGPSLVAAPAVPGLGFGPNPDRLAAVTIRRTLLARR
jgi:O-succinylbenzoate synthase